MACNRALVRLILLPWLLPVGSFVSAGCATSRPSFDLRLCALVSACSNNASASLGVGAMCETLQCSGDVLVVCDPLDPNLPPNFHDCTQDGQHCFQGASGAACGTGTCDPAAAASSCQGDVLVRCIDVGTAAAPSGVLVPTDCSKQYGWYVHLDEGDGCDEAMCDSLYANTCGVAGGAAQCMGSGPACPSDFVASCSGTVVSSCTGGTVAHFDCASLGPLTCQDSSPPGHPGCVDASTECDGLGDETCEDGVITLCMFGARTTMDCKSYGLSGCTTALSGTQTLAQCTR